MKLEDVLLALLIIVLFLSWIFAVIALIPSVVIAWRALY